MKTKGGGKKKGSAFEREVAKELSLWLTKGKDSKQLIRSVLSGGWTAHRRTSKEKWRHAGDLAPNGPAGDIFREVVAVECKHYGTIDLYTYWAESSLLNVWWKKITEEAHEADVSPMLVFRGNLRPTMVALDVGIWTQLMGVGAQPKAVLKARQSAVHLTAWHAVLMPLSDFVKCARPELLDAVPLKRTVVP